MMHDPSADYCAVSLLLSHNPKSQSHIQPKHAQAVVIYTQQMLYDVICCMEHLPLHLA